MPTETVMYSVNYDNGTRIRRLLVDKIKILAVAERVIGTDARFSDEYTASEETVSFSRHNALT